MCVPFHLPPNKAKVIQVIWVSAMRGDGSEQNPERSIDLYFSLDGQLFACFNPINGPADSFNVPDSSACKCDPIKEAA